MTDNIVKHEDAAFLPMQRVNALINDVAMIQHAMKSVMKDKEHYGAIPGCGPKPTLLKSGAEKLASLFQFRPGGLEKIILRDLGNFHREYHACVDIVHYPSGNVVGQGVGSCSTMESKYRYRKAGQKCPECGKETIIKGKKEYGGGWLCFAKNGGCGAKFADGNKLVENQNMGRVENPDIADVYNTVLKMAKKRAFVDGILTSTAASDLFTQDIEDFVEDPTPREIYVEGQKAPERSGQTAPERGEWVHGTSTVTMAVDDAEEARPTALEEFKAKATALKKEETSHLKNLLLIYKERLAGGAEAFSWAKKFAQDRGYIYDTAAKEFVKAAPVIDVEYLCKAHGFECYPHLADWLLKTTGMDEFPPADATSEWANLDSICAQHVAEKDYELVCSIFQGAHSGDKAAITVMEAAHKNNRRAVVAAMIREFDNPECLVGVEELTPLTSIYHKYGLSNTKTNPL